MRQQINRKESELTDKTFTYRRRYGGCEEENRHHERSHILGCFRECVFKPCDWGENFADGDEDIPMDNPRIKIQWVQWWRIRATYAPVWIQTLSGETSGATQSDAWSPHGLVCKKFFSKQVNRPTNVRFYLINIMLENFTMSSDECQSNKK